MTPAQVPRFWAERTADVSLAGGYLTDPEETWWGSTSRNPEVVSTADLAGNRCLVLLGSAGAGKSSVIADPACPLRGPLAPIELGLATTDTGLERLVVESPAVRNWQASGDELTLVLDALDEAKLQVPTAEHIVSTWVRAWPADRLRLRLVARGSSWSGLLEEALRDAYGDALKVVELQPLRRDDVAAWVSSEGLDAERFLAEVEAVGTAVMASRPLTLRMLVSQFRRDGGLSSDPAELYGSGLLAICEETNPNRLASGTTGRLTAAQRFSVATRMGAASVLGGQLLMGRQADRSEVLDEATLVGGSEGAGAAQSAVTKDAVAEVFGTALVSAAAPGVRRWDHATFGDYLAARWIVDNDLVDAQVRSLIVAPDGRLWPQTRLVAGWCVTIDPARFGWLVDADPTAFASDLDLPNDTIRRTIVDAVFSNPVLAGRVDWPKLVHPGLDDQVRAALANDDFIVRRAGLDAVRDLDRDTLVEDMVTFALNGGGDAHARATAANLAVGAERRTVPALLPLVAESDDNDESWDGLLGAGLLACWPHVISTADVLAILREPKRSNYFGPYNSFLHVLADELAEDDLDAVVDWVGRLGLMPVGHNVARVANAAVDLVLCHLDQPSALDAVCKLARERTHVHLGIVFDSYSDSSVAAIEDATIRRSLIDGLAARVSDEDEMARVLGFGHDRLCRADDLGWAIDRYAASASSTVGRSYEMVARQSYDPLSRAHLELVSGLPPDHPARPAFVDVWLEPIVLDSDYVKSGRERIERHKPAEKTTDGLNRRLPGLLESFDKKQKAAFCTALALITIPVGGDRDDDWVSDITSCDRWPTVDPEVQSAIVRRCPEFLAQANCTSSSWLGAAQYALDTESAAGLRCLVLLLRDDLDTLAALSPQLWRRWAPAFIARALPGLGDEDVLALIEAAEAAGVDDLALIAAADIVPVGDRHPWVDSSTIDRLWGPVLRNALLQLVKTGSAKERRWSMEQLARCDPDALIAQAATALVHDRRSEADLIRFGLDLMLHRDFDGAWPTVRHYLDRVDDPETALAVLGRDRYSRYGSLSDCSSRRLADAYAWLRRTFPPTSDPEMSGALGRRHFVAELRDSLVTTLEERATPGAIAALRHIADAFPDFPSLRYSLATAEASALRSQWTSTPWSQLAALSEVTSARLVRSGGDLLDAVVAALNEVQQRLTGAVPESHLLWNTDSMRPKTEEEATGYLHNRLHDLLVTRHVIVNSEVEVRRTHRTGRPRQVDLQVDTVVDGLRVTVPIEVKGSWHKDVETALDAQLVDEYMQDIGPHGIYLVLWPDLTSWSVGDSRRQRAARLDRDEVMSRLEADARTSDVHGLDVRVVGLDLAYAQST
ncbi:MAG: hypothetical protein WBA45_01905 [Microthrixaceae bacterium]